MSFLGVGPTELRIMLAAGAFVAAVKPVVAPFGAVEVLLFDLGGMVGVAGMVMTFLITSSVNARALFLEETHRS